MVAPATSGSVAFDQAAARIIAGALRICGIIQEDETPTAAMALNALETLNAMVKGWQASQIHVWCEEEAILFLQPNQPQYQLGAGSPDRACLFRDFFQTSLSVTVASGVSITLASTVGSLIGGVSLSIGDTIAVQLDAGTNFWTTVSNIVGSVVTLVSGLPTQATAGALVFAYSTPLMRPLRCPAGRRYNYLSAIQTPMIVLSRLDYDVLPNQLPPTTGTVTQYFYDPHTGSGVYSTPTGFFNVWPAPENNANAVRFVMQRPLQDFSTLANVPDFPAEWLAALRWNLALEIGPEYDVPAERIDVIAKRAGYWYGLAAAWDKEPESVLFGMAFEPAYRTG